MSANTDPTGAPTPALDALLTKLRASIVRQVRLHGIGSVALVAAVWVAFAFVADWGLHVPKVVRLLHFGVWIALPLYILRRDWLLPQRRVPEREDLAVLVDRAYPQHRELFVSAAQLARRPDGDRALVANVLARAERAVQEISPQVLVSPTGPRRRFALGSVAATLVVLGFALRPDHAAIFFSRMVGGDRPWPQRTQLRVEVPLAADRGQVQVGDDVIEVRVARGTDVPVLVVAEGVTPDEVLLTFSDGQRVALPPASGGRFRTTLHSVQEDLSFRATGGDDEDGRPRVDVIALQPPDIEGLAIRIQPPAYTGLPARVEHDRDVEFLAGSELAVVVLPSPRDATGEVHLLPEDARYPLEPRPWIPRPTDAGAEGEALTGLGFERVANETLHFRVELTDAGGLQNPDPGLFNLRAVPDRAPELALLSPGRFDVETIPGGALPLRVRAEDDFGLASLAWRSTPFLDGAVPGAATPLSLLAIDEGDGATGPSGSELRRALGETRLEAAELAPAGTALEPGQQFELEVLATDNREPEANETTSPKVRVRVVTPDELNRRIQDRLARARMETTSLAQLQRDKRTRVEELLASLADDGASGWDGSDWRGGDAVALQTALSGQRRVQGDAAALARELASITEVVLYARLDEKAGGLLEYLDGALAGTSDRTFDPEPWRALAAQHAEGRLGSPAFAGHLVEILDLALLVSEDVSASAVASLEEAQLATDLASVADALELSIQRQDETLRRVEDLLERLSQWDTFQNVLTLTRDILQRQEDLQERLRQYYSETDR